MVNDLAEAMKASDGKKKTIGFCIAGIFGPDEVMTVSSAGRHRLWLEKDSSEDSYQDISEASRLSAASSRRKRKSFIGAPSAHCKIFKILEIFTHYIDRVNSDFIIL